eukprot:TRINITY_DN3143_c3_g1_i1.p1 TRINITY_DN3143_c3_g1~~TRINITY_DN3143_c3_g1_i1.p1  ORF type:complete len:242 (+),score=66.12 TRINITY_DN3143_c3_g1_i1:149-874(+)
MLYPHRKLKRQKYNEDIKAHLTAEDIRARQRALERITNDKEYSHLQMGSPEFFATLNDLIALEKRRPSVDKLKNEKSRLERRRHTLAVVQGLSNMHAFLGMATHSDDEFSDIDEESLSPMIDQPEIFARRHSMVDLRELRERKDIPHFETFDEIFLDKDMEIERHKLPPLPKTPFISEEKAIVESPGPCCEEIWEAGQPFQTFSPTERNFPESPDNFYFENTPKPSTSKNSEINISTQRTV